MAEKHIHTVNLRAVRNVAPRRRAGKAMNILREYVERHTGAESISISPTVNERLWADGARNPPKTVEVQVAVDDGTAHVELVEHDLAVPSADGEAATETVELTDEELAELNVDEVKDLVEAGDVAPQRALDVEYAGKNRKTLIEWLQDRIGADDEDAEVEEETVDEDEPAEDEPTEDETVDEESDDSEEDEDAGRETYDLPDDVVETFEEGTIGDGKDAAKDLGKDQFEKLLNFEEAHQNRKGMKKFLRSNMN